MSLNDLLEAELRRCQAECDAVSAELQRIVAGANPQALADLAPAIGAVLKRLKQAADRLHDTTLALQKVIQTRAP